MTCGQKLCWLIGVLIATLAQPGLAQTQVTEPSAPASATEVVPLQPDSTLTPTPLPPPDSDAPLPPPDSDAPLPPPGASAAAPAAPGAPDPDDWDLPRPTPPAPVPAAATPIARPTDPDDAMPPAPLPPGPLPPAPIEPAPPEPEAAEALPPPPPVPMAPPASYAAPAIGITRSPSVIAQCLCAQRQTSALHHQAEHAQQAYFDGKSRLTALDDQLARTKATIDTDDEAQVDAYRRLLLQSEQENSQLYNETLPQTQSIVGRYNEAVNNYNARCTGRRFDSAVLAQVTASLVCR